MNLYPMRLEQDLFWSQRKLLVRVLTGRVNRLIEDASTLPEEQVISILYKGINQRALYAVGAHMARTIDQELGREALAETVGGGPRTFIETYNQLVNDPWRITELPAPPTLNPTQALRRAARQADVERIPKLIAQIAELPAESLNGAAFEEILSAGLILRERGQVDLAVQVFESLVSCFPDHPQSHIRLGHAYLSAGKQALAKGCYDRALDIDPSLAILIE
jgi:tetratricopeptide (TPR) repeat protein